MLGRSAGESTVRRVDKLKALTPSDWLIVAGGAIVLVFGLARWFSWDASSGNVVIEDQTSNAFDYLVTGVIPWLLAVGAAVITVLLRTDALRPGKVPWPQVMLGVTSLAFILILIRLIVSVDPDVSGTDVDVDVSRGIGIWMSAVGALIATVGAFLAFRTPGQAYKPVTGGPQPEREIPPPGDVTTP
jgi:hypothetical protein